MSAPLRIGLFQDAFYPVVDGVCQVVDHTAAELAKRAEVTVFVPAYKGRPYDDSRFPYRVVRSRSMRVPGIDYSLPLPKLDPEFKKALQETPLDIVHIHAPFTIGKAGINYAKKHGIPVVGTMHSQFRRDFQRAVKLRAPAQLLTSVLIRTFEKCDECWAVNKAMAKLYHEEYGYSKVPYVMPNATDLCPVADPAESARRVNAAYGLKEEEAVLLFVGRLNNLKNVFLIAESLAHIKAKAKRPIRMLFTGSGQDEKELRNRVREYGVEDVTVFTGEVRDRSDLSDIYARADLMLFPSLYDASSLVQIEAASQGTPVLFAKGAITADTITVGVNGYAAPPEAKAYAEAVLEILSDPEGLRRTGENATRDLWVSWEMAADAAYRRYEEIIAARK